jgi:hypothetical protein
MRQKPVAPLGAFELLEKEFGDTGHRGESTNALQGVFLLNRAVNAMCREGIRLRSRVMARAVAPIVVAVALVFGAVACGDDPNDEFTEQYNQAVQPLSALGDDVAASLSGAGGQPDRELAAQFEKLADRADQTRKNLSELEPPEDASDEFDELLAALKQSVADLRAVAAAAKEGDPAAGQEAGQAIAESGLRLREAERDFQNAVDG